MAGPHTTFLPGVVAKALGRIWIIDVFDLWLDNAVDLGYVERGSIPHRIVARLEELAFRQSDHAIVLTPTMARQFGEKHELNMDDLTPVPFGVDRDLFSPDAGSEVQNRIVYFGNLGEAQAFVPFIKGFARTDEDLQLHIAGSGERREELEKMTNRLGIRDRVTFEGMLPREEVSPLVATSLLSIVPLKTGEEYKLDYARPTKLVESMAAGTPFVASNVEEIERVAEMSRAGFAVENEPKAVADAIAEICENKQTRNLMSEHAVEFIQQHHDWASLTSDVKQILSFQNNPDS